MQRGGDTLEHPWATTIQRVVRIARAVGPARVALVLVCVAIAAAANAQSLGGFVSPGELAAAHHEVAGVTQCLACHTVGSGLSAAKCLSCHDRIQEQVDSGRGFHADKGEACADCHPDHRGADFDMVHFDEEDQEAFDHAETGFDLHGAHAEAACTDCHTEDGTWLGLTSTCRNCHDDPHGSDVGRPFLRECSTCHGDVRWSEIDAMYASFDHDDPGQADFALHGQHADVACEDCHGDFRFVPTASETCEDCHDDIHGGQFAPRACDDCHTVEVAGFQLRGFDHDRTDWPLAPAHADVRCEACHGDGRRARYVDLPHDRCDTCHEDPHDGQFAPRDCVACHTDLHTSFEMAGFDHDDTAFPLRRAHAEVACSECHGDGPEGTFAGLDFADCSSCHDDPHEDRFAPDTCASCHLDGTWEVESFDHDRTDFPLTGAHTDAACTSCHGDAESHVLRGLPFASCADCHGDEDPHHTESTATCTSCHVTEAWVDVTFDHHAGTGFALAGRHAPLGCADCHVDDLTFLEADPACERCHEPDRPPRHWEGTCATCHGDAGWVPASLDARDHAATGFALHGAHATVACESCHDGRASTAPSCESCHADDDPHGNLLGNTCDRCHTEAQWFVIRFTHATTGWPLKGSHRLAACTDCHATGFIGTPNTCRRCHDRDKPRDTLHSDPLTRDCETCHRPYAWEPAVWPHGELR